MSTHSFIRVLFKSASERKARFKLRVKRCETLVTTQGLCFFLLYYFSKQTGASYICFLLMYFICATVMCVNVMVAVNRQTQKIQMQQKNTAN